MHIVWTHVAWPTRQCNSLLRELWNVVESVQLRGSD